MHRHSVFVLLVDKQQKQEQFLCARGECSGYVFAIAVGDIEVAEQRYGHPRTVVVGGNVGLCCQLRQGLLLVNVSIWGIGLLRFGRSNSRAGAVVGRVRLLCVGCRVGPGSLGVGWFGASGPGMHIPAILHGTAMQYNVFTTSLCQTVAATAQCQGGSTRGSK